MILAGFALFIIFLLIIGMPVAFTLTIAGILGIIQFIDMSTLSQVPVIAYKTLDSYVLTSVPLYIPHRPDDPAGRDVPREAHR